MKAHIISVLVLDFDELGAEQVKETLESQNYPNRCINPSVLGSMEVDIGEWDDDHPLNKHETDAALWLAERMAK